MKKIFILLLVFQILINPVSAYVWVSNGTIKLVDEGKINSTTLESKLDSWLIKNSNFGNLEDYMNQSSQNVWIYRRPIECGNNSTLIFDSADDCEKLFLGATIGEVQSQVEFGTRLTGSNSYGAFVFRNIYVIGWNESAGKIISNYTDMVKIEAYDLVLENTSFNAIKGIDCYNRLNEKTGKVSNITINDSERGINSYNLNGVTFSNIKLNNISLSGFRLDNCNECELYDYHFVNDPSFRNSSNNQGFGVVLNGGHDNYIHNLNVDSPRWSGLYFYHSKLEHDTRVENMTVLYAGHSGIDVHAGYNLTLQNITVSDTNGSSFFISGPNRNVPGYEDYGIYNVTFQDISSYRPSLTTITIGNRTSHVYINNISIENKLASLSYGIKVLDCDNITVIGSYVDRQCPISWYLTTYDEKKTKDISLIDASLYNSSYTDIYCNRSSNAKLLNTKYGKILANSDTDYFQIYYMDLITKYKNGSILPYTKIEINSDISKYQSQNGYARDKTTFYTDSKGHTYLPNNKRSNSPAIVQYHKNLDGSYDVPSHTITIVTPKNKTISLSGITPDSSWYRPDPNIPTYTITAIIPDDSTGPHISGFAPSTENPFNSGEKKNFRVWTDEPLTGMEWRVNGSSVLKGALNYTWNVTDRNTTIEFIGSNVNGTVNQVWNLGENPDNKTQEIKLSPTDTILTRNVSEKVDFSVSPDIFTTKAWYINGCLVRNNTTSMSKCWSSAGTYNVTFSGSTSKETVLHTWTVKVVEEPKEQNKTIVTIAPEYQVIEPKKPFNLSIKIEPETSITGTQLDFIFNSSMTSANNVTEGDLLKQNGAYTIFSSGTINNSAGTVKNIYGFILGTSNVSTPGTMATVNLTAGNKTGMAKFSLSNVIISDVNSKSAPYNVTNATVLIDTAPVIASIEPKSVNEKRTLAFKVSAKDADGDRLVLSASGVPQGAFFNTTSGNFTWTPAVGQAGVYTITFKVSDGYLTDSQSVTVTVNKLNNPPVMSSFEPLNGSFSEGERIGISVNASDAEGQALNYSIRIDGVVYATNKEYVWETDYSSSGNHTIEAAVSDGIDEVKKQHIIYITECRPRWDVDENGIVNILDVTSVSRKYGTTVNKPYPRYDVNQDGNINILDLTLVGNHFGEYVN